MSDQPGDGLFELPSPAPSTPSEARHVRPAYTPTNDVALIREVLDQAADPGYVLIGAGQSVWRRLIRRGAEVEPTTPAEANAVRQLLDRGLLVLGGVRPARRGRHDTPATSVLLTTAARAQQRRWRTTTHTPEVTGHPTRNTA